MTRVSKLTAAAVVCLLQSTLAMAQLSNPLSTRVINYKTAFDDPYDINQLWLNISPLAYTVGSDNISLGFGLSARLFVKDKLQFSGGFQTSYAAGTDFMRNSGTKNASIHIRPEGVRHDQTQRQINLFIPYMTVELGGQYAIKDIEKKSTSRIMLTSKKVRVMEFTNVDEIRVNSRNRIIWAARAGAQSFTSTVSLNRAMEKQGATLENAEGGIKLLPDGSTLTGASSSTKYRNQLYSNLSYASVYLGGNYQFIRNVAVKADKFGNLANNIIVTSFADVIIAPNPMLEDVRVARAAGGYDVFSAKGLRVRPYGFRAGIDMNYNQDLHYSFGAEMGVRPGLAGQGFYIAGRVSIPAFAFRLNRQRLANQTNSVN